MILHYTSRLLDQRSWSEPVFRDESCLFPVYHGNLADRLTSSEKGFFLGLVEKRPDGFYFVPYKPNIGGTSVNGNGNPSADIKKITPDTELEIFDLEKFPIGYVRLTNYVRPKDEDRKIRLVPGYYARKSIRLLVSRVRKLLHS